MLKIDITDDMKTCHKEYFEQYVLVRFKEEIYKRIVKDRYLDEKIIAEFMKYCSNNWGNIAVGDFSVLQEINKDIEDNFFSKIRKRENFNDYCSFILDVFSYRNFGHNQAEWSPNEFIKRLNIRVCPYCNRQYITSVVSKEHKIERTDLDHFLPKSIYPYFSMSLYNLIPCCKFCNQSLKKDIDFDFNVSNPYCDDYNKQMTFQLKFAQTHHNEHDECGLFFDDVAIDIVENNSGVNQIKKVFMIPYLSGQHNDVAVDFLRKRVSYPDEKLEQVIALARLDGYSLKESLMASLLGYPLRIEEIDKNALGKLKRDLAIQLGFLHTDYTQLDSSLINDLREVLQKRRKV